MNLLLSTLCVGKLTIEARLASGLTHILLFPVAIYPHYLATFFIDMQGEVLANLGS